LINVDADREYFDAYPWVSPVLRPPAADEHEGWVMAVQHNGEIHQRLLPMPPPHPYWVAVEDEAAAIAILKWANAEWDRRMAFLQMPSPSAAIH
jgi:hypothetical protein